MTRVTVAMVTTTLLGTLLLSATPALGQRVLAERQRQEALRYYRLGQEFMYVEDFARAEREFERAIQSDRLLALAHFGLGQALMEQRRYSGAIRAFTDCRDTYNEIARFATTNAAEHNRRLEDEIQELSDTLRTLRSGRIQFAGREHMIMQVETRITSLQNARRRDNLNFAVPAEVSLALGSAHFRHGALADAEDAYKQAIRANSRFGEAYNNLAVVYLFTERFELARDAVADAERHGYLVNPQLKADLENALNRR